MTDEFIKGLGCLVVGGLGWMTIAGWYRTPSFEGAQLTGPVDLAEPTVYDQIALAMGSALFWFAVVGALTFWVLLPAFEQARDAWADRSD